MYKARASVITFFFCLTADVGSTDNFPVPFMQFIRSLKQNNQTELQSSNIKLVSLENYLFLLFNNHLSAT